MRSRRADRSYRQRYRSPAAACGLVGDRCIILGRVTIKPAHRRIATITVGVVVLLAFIIAGMTLRVPYVALGPGPTVNTLGDVEGKPVVAVSDAVDPHPKGNLNLTTVSLIDGLTLFQALGMWASSKITRRVAGMASLRSSASASWPSDAVHRWWR